MDKISKHISYKEATHSNTALRRGIDNIPDVKEIENMSDTRMIANRQTMVEEFKRTPSLVYQAIDQQPGAKLKSSNGTWWGAMNAVTFVVDHKWGHDRDASLHNAWFGGRASLKQRAMNKAIEYARAA